MRAPLITFLSDFGDREGYVASVKGVLLAIAPGATVVDISHQVPPQDIHNGAFVLWSCYRMFPLGTVHLAVADPGVGTRRRALLLVTKDYAFIGPDNGLFTYVLRDAGAEAHSEEDVPPLEPRERPLPPGVKAFHLSKPDFWRHPVSHTFHARDVFAPVAAHLASGVPPEGLGEPVGSAVQLHIPEPRWQDDALVGHVLHIDRFGNLITSISEQALGPEGETLEIEVAHRRILGRATSYAEGDLVALINSQGLLEVSVRNGSAARLLAAGVGDTVRATRLGQGDR
ncbi:MAG: SAM-dependent chlorinase/fluorinase [Chloroflexi bacterium]|nr:SAM-dependent chlorinase/fluorinase [Chloroflexota bacterium]